LGGSANIALNLSKLDINVYLISVCGNDKYNNKIIEILDNNKINHYIITDNNRKTTIKNRIISNNIINTRFDIEDTFDINSDFEKNILNKIKELDNKNKIDGIILSDYNKGVITILNSQNIINYANNNNILTFIDPKINNISKYKNCTIFKPNLLESSLISDKNNIEEKIKDIYNKITCKIVVITLGKDGMIFYDGNIINKVYEKKNLICIDPTGAGDIVISILTYYYIKTKNINLSVQISNYIASKSIEYIGNYCISLDDINEFENKDLNIITKKILNMSDLELLKKYYYGKKIIFTNGCFDIIHIAHLKLLKYSKSIGDILIVGLNSDYSIKKNKGDLRPINNENDRIDFLLQLDFIDHIIVFSDNTPFNILSIIKPDVIVKGGDYTEDNIIGKEFCKEVIIFNYINNKSTTNIINKILNK
jgi:D-beta-D-heptose 7-phosphate kinase/D-beta-D-heptose 1-phosphate adenosyltransferase